MRRGFTLTETVITLVIAGTLSGAAVYLTTRDAAPGNETQARAAVWAGWQAQVGAEVTGQAPADAALLTLIDPTGSYTDGEADQPGEVSVTRAGGVAYLSARSPDGTCWSLRYDSRPGGPSGSRQVVWAVIAPGVLEGCDTRLAALQDRMDGIAAGDHPMDAPALIDS